MCEPAVLRAGVALDLPPPGALAEERAHDLPRVIWPAPAETDDVLKRVLQQSTADDNAR